MTIANNENFTEWKANVDRWKAKYEYKIRTFSPANIVVAKRCCKCGSIREKMHRHHKGHEYVFACLMEERYAARYIQFHPNDVDWLCFRCHKRAHTIYKRVMKALWDYVGLCERSNMPLQYEALEEFRDAILAAYNRWIRYKKKKKRSRKKPRGGANGRSKPAARSA